ncbi:hypothetical protein FOZ61_009949 [Perkinsus olseni]|uniref:Uncharacterized protein n=1 Tax=Perkinsus olseni TaxID=32597 RepID=A0A7J6KYS1_PEROL|nr:hypothetical protein FOZ61_009949 [Perkinsus olseni]
MSSPSSESAVGRDVRRSSRGSKNRSRRAHDRDDKGSYHDGDRASDEDGLGKDVDGTGRNTTEHEERKGQHDVNDDANAEEAKTEVTAPPTSTVSTVNPLMLPPHEIDLVRGQLVLLQSIPYLPANQRAVIEGYDQKTCKYRVTLMNTPQPASSASSSNAPPLPSQVAGGKTNQWAVFRENIRVIPPYHIPSRRPFPSRHCGLHQFPGFSGHSDDSKHPKESLTTGDSVLASVNAGRSYTLVNVAECRKLEPYHHHQQQQQQQQQQLGERANNAIKNTDTNAQPSSSTYALILSYPPDSEVTRISKRQIESDVESVLSADGVADTTGMDATSWMLFREGDRVYAPSSAEKGRFQPGIIAKDHEVRSSTPSKDQHSTNENTAEVTVPVAFARGGARKVERVPRSMLFHRCPLPDMTAQAFEVVDERKRGRERSEESVRGEHQQQPSSKHRRVEASLSGQLGSSQSTSHRKVPLLEELGLYHDDGGQETEQDSARMTDEEWEVVEKGMRILKGFGVDALISSDKREVFPVFELGNDAARKSNGLPVDKKPELSSSLRRWIEEKSPWPRKKDTPDADILRKLSGIETHECSSFWMIPQDGVKKEE